jgi:LPS sulfotransferase NodH
MSGVKYIIASSPRTGSFLLSGGLEATGSAGRPNELFCPGLQHFWRHRWGLEEHCDFGSYLRAAVRYGTTSNGVFGLKLHWMHLKSLATAAGVIGNEARVLEALFPSARFIHIIRNDLRAQALSYFRALQTGKWWQINEIDNAQKRFQKLIFDPAAVLALEKLLFCYEQAWRRYFLEWRIPFLTIQYEILAADYRGEIARVLSFLGLDSSAASRLPPPRLRRQADAITVKWRKRMDEMEVASTSDFAPKSRFAPRSRYPSRHRGHGEAQLHDAIQELRQSRWFPILTQLARPVETEHCPDPARR